MKYVFEDSKDAKLSVFFRETFNDTSDFVYSNGNRKLLDLVKTIDTQCIVYLDLQPRNKSAVTVYNDLRIWITKNNKQVFVIPIVCAEFYLICSMNPKLFKEPFLSISDYVGSRTYEKYCKTFLNSRIACNINNFVTVDCKCNSAKELCKSINLHTKSNNYVRKYPCYPINGIENSIRMSDNDLIKLHKILVQRFNYLSNLKIEPIDYSFLRK